MALRGKTAEEQIYNFLIGKGMTPAGAAGLMGNLYAESGLKPTNIQNSYETLLQSLKAFSGAKRATGATRR